MVEKRKAPKNCFWRGDTLWGRFEVAGKEVRRSLRTGDARVAERRVADLHKLAVAEAHYGEKRVTWGDAMLGWSRAIAGHAKPSTITRYVQSLELIRPVLNDLTVDQINKAVVNDVVRRRRAAGVTNATIRRDLVALSSVLAYCEDEDWIDANHALAKMRRLKERRDPIILPQPAHIEAVIARAPGNFGAMIRAAWLTGCRQDELRQLQRSHLDFRRKQVSIWRTKTNKARVIEMRDAEALFAGLPVSLRSKTVFWHGEGEPFSNIASNFHRLVAKVAASAQTAAQKAGRPAGDFRPFRFHDLRHLFAVEYLRDGGGIYALSRHLGHTSVKTTEIYLDHLTEAERTKAMAGSAQKPDQEKGFSPSQEPLNYDVTK